jgi:hypothetical protein
MKYSFHSLTPSLELFCNCQFLRLDTIQFLCSQVHILAGWRLETRLIFPNSIFLYNHFARTTQKTQPLFFGIACLHRFCIQRNLLDCCLCIRCRGNMFTESLPSNERLFWLHYCGFRASCHNIFCQSLVERSNRNSSNGTLCLALAQWNSLYIKRK